MRYIRFGSRNHARWAVLEGDRARTIRGSLLDRWEPTGETHALGNLRLLAPCEPNKVVAIGLDHVAHAEVMVRAKELSVQVQNFNYHRTN